jgi:hypothetical protein
VEKRSVTSGGLHFRERGGNEPNYEAIFGICSQLPHKKANLLASRTSSKESLLRVGLDPRLIHHRSSHPLFPFLL